MDNGVYKHLVWNYDDLVHMYKDNTLDVKIIREKIDEYIYDAQGHPSFKGGWFLWHLLKYKNSNKAYRISEEKFDNIIRLMFAAKNKTHIVNGFDMFIDEKDSLGLSTNNKFEPFETEIVNKLIHEGDVVLDIGANIGYYSLLFSKLVGNRGKVYAFEPDPDNYQLLSKNVKLNNLQNIFLYNKGVSNEIGESFLYQCPHNNGMHRSYPSILCDKKIPIEMMVLDKMPIFHDKKVDFIKIDIEGYEYHALSGMKNIINSNKEIKILTEFSPTALLESGNNPNMYLDFLEEHNFVIYSVEDLSSPIDTNVLREELEIITDITYRILEKYSIQKYESITALSQEIEEKQLGYTRPLFENFLCIKRESFYFYSQISFPLNVYAFLTYYDTGEFRELHYGLFNENNDDMVQAQKNSTALLFKYLDRSPAKLLEVGVGLGKTHQKLIDKGFDCTGITPDSAQISIVHDKIKEANLICTRFEDFNPQEIVYDIILFQESAQYIQAKDIFQKSYNLLSPHGKILIVDEFSIGKIDLHEIDDFVNIARQSGFELVHKIDLSGRASPSEDYIFEGLHKYKNRLCIDLILEASMVDHLIDAVVLHKSGYKDGTRGYFFFEFRKVV